MSFLCAFELQRPDREIYCQYSLSGLTTLLFCVVAFSGLSRVGILLCLSFFFFGLSVLKEFRKCWGLVLDLFCFSKCLKSVCPYSVAFLFSLDASVQVKRTA